MATAQPSSRPRYQLIEKAYIDDILHDPESRPMDPETEERKPLLVYFDGIPGPHMIPVNEAAKKMVEKHPTVMQDPIAALSIVGNR